MIPHTGVLQAIKWDLIMIIFGSGAERERVADGHTVLISEYSAPEDFICLLEINHTSGVNKSKRVERIERLYTFDPLKV